MAALSSEHERQVADIRAFNRFHTVLVGALDDGILKSPYSLTEARVLFEIVHRESCTAAELARDLRIDPAYLSRLLRRFRSRDLISVRKSERDGRERIVLPTGEGRRVLEALEAASTDEIGRLIADLSEERRGALVRAMGTIREILDRAEGRDGFVLRPHRPGDVGWIVHRHAVLYSRDYGWDGSFESFVADIGRQFLENFDAEREYCWIAERHGAVAGSVTVVNGGNNVAKLRLLYVEAEARGLGIGSKLVEEAIRFARRCGYRKIVLWTDASLAPARRLYVAAGFRLVSEERHRSFGRDLVGQYWEMDLVPVTASS